MNRREFLKLIPAVIGGAIAAKFVNSRERAIDCGSDKTIGGLPAKEYICEMYMPDDDHALLCPEQEIWSSGNGDGVWWCVTRGGVYYSRDNCTTWKPTHPLNALKYFAMNENI